MLKGDDHSQVARWKCYNLIGYAVLVKQGVKFARDEWFVFRKFADAALERPETASSFAERVYEKGGHEKTNSNADRDLDHGCCDVEDLWVQLEME
jgi:hypothetical protein